MQRIIILISIFSSIVIESCNNRSAKKSLTTLPHTNKAEVDIARIDSVIHNLDLDPTILKRIFDTVAYVREDGGKKSDSVYYHAEYYYRYGELVKVKVYGKNGLWRQDRLAYYLDGKTIKYSEGETLVGSLDFGKLNFEIYYVDDIAIKLVWLTKKPDNVIGVDTKSLLKKSFNLLQNAHTSGF